MYELFGRNHANVAERVFLTSLSLISLQIPRNTYMFIVIIYILYIKSKGPVGQDSYRNVFRMGLNVAAFNVSLDDKLKAATFK